MESLDETVNAHSLGHQKDYQLLKVPVVLKPRIVREHSKVPRRRRLAQVLPESIAYDPASPATIKSSA